MPVVLRVKGYKFWFYEADLNERPHVHVGKEGRETTFRLKPVALAHAGRLKPVDMQEIKHIIDDNHDFFLRAWEVKSSEFKTPPVAG